MAPLTWLVTGCSSGFGEKFVHAILARGDRVIASGRNAAVKLAHLQDTSAAVLDLDVSKPPEELVTKIQEALKIYGGIDVLVNNAGYIDSGVLEELSSERLTRSLETNFLGPINLTRAILPHFRAKNSGTLLYVGSQAGWKGDPGASAYVASKFALEGVVECLQQELAIISSGVRSIIFEPGYFKTQIFSPKNLIHEADLLPEYSAFNAMSRQYEAGLYGNEPGDPAKAVERMIDVVKGENFAAGKSLPPRMPLGTDGLKVIRDKCQASLQICDEWEELIVSTDDIVNDK